VRQNKNAQQSILFAVHFLRCMTRGEKNLFPLAANGSPLGANGMTDVEKKVVCLRYKKYTTNSRDCHASKKTHGKLFFTVCIFFAVRPKENTRERFSRGAKVSFPVLPRDLDVPQWYSLALI
jgi:hypothetical protein